MIATTATAGDSVGSVIVTYLPDAGFAERLAAIAQQARSLVLVDNSDTAEAQEAVCALCAKIGCELIAHRENLGLATALNEAFGRHAHRGLEWAVAFDQDSTPERGLIEALLAAARSSHSPAAVVGANWTDAARPGFSARHLKAGRFPLFFARRPAGPDLDQVTCVITSGSLFHLPTWRALGGFDEGLFLDLVDTDYCLRARHAKHQIRVAPQARLLHQRGAKRPVRLLGRTWWPAFMTPVRLRYLFRNRMRLLARHGPRTPHWALFELVYSIKIAAEILFLESNKRAKLGACLRGTWEGLLGRAGKLH